MATSGTTIFNPSLTEIAEEAWERASGGATELRSGYDFRTVRRSLNLLLMEWANRGINLWTVTEASMPLIQGQAEYSLPLDTVDMIQQVTRTNPGSQTQQMDINLSRISVATYSTIPNKLVTGRPIQVYVDRQRDNPRIFVWPTPSDNTYTLVYWYLRRLQDAGNGTNTEDIPFRFYPAMIAGLAWLIAMKIPEGAARVDTLKMQYDEQIQMAMDEDRSKAPVRFVPRVTRVGRGL